MGYLSLLQQRRFVPSRSYNEHLYTSLIMVVEHHRSYLLHFATNISPSSLGLGLIGARLKVDTTRLWKNLMSLRDFKI